MFLLQAAQPGGSLNMPIFMGLIMVVFYFFFIRPQQKKQKQQKLFIDDLKKGDKVITLAGIHGSINKINEDGTISLEINPGSYIKMEKSSISMEMTAQAMKAANTPLVVPDKK